MHVRQCGCLLSTHERASLANLNQSANSSCGLANVRATTVIREIAYISFLPDLSFPGHRSNRYPPYDFFFLPLGKVSYKAVRATRPVN